MTPWLSSALPTILASPEYTSGTTVVFVTFDEGSGGETGENCATNTTDNSCHVLTIVISPSTRAGATSATLFNHYSLLATTEQLLGLPALGQAASAGYHDRRVQPLTNAAGTVTGRAQRPRPGGGGNFIAYSHECPLGSVCGIGLSGFARSDALARGERTGEAWTWTIRGPARGGRARHRLPFSGAVPGGRQPPAVPAGGRRARRSGGGRGRGQPAGRPYRPEPGRRGGDGDDRRPQARRDPHAGEPVLRPLLRHPAGRPGLLPTSRSSSTRTARRSSSSPTSRAPTSGTCCPSTWTPPRWTRRTRATSTTAGPATTARATAGCGTTGSPPRPSRRWATSPATTCRSTTRSPTRSPSATATTSRYSGRPARTGCTSGRAPPAAGRRTRRTTPSSSPNVTTYPELLLKRGHLLAGVHQPRGGRRQREQRLGRRLRRQPAVVLPAVPDLGEGDHDGGAAARRPGRRAAVAAERGHPARAEPRQPRARPVHRRLRRGHDSAGVLDRRAVRVLRAPVGEPELRRALRADGARGADGQPGAVGDHGAVHHLRRARRLLRPRAAGGARDDA